MIIKDITAKESIDENLNTWCYEVGSRFEEIGVDAADDFHFFFKKREFRDLIGEDVYDLGSGDGASSRRLHNLGYYVISIDINKEKLEKCIASVKIQEDILTFLKDVPDGYGLGNVFTHHSLEHMVDAPEIIELIGKLILPGRIYYAIVPAGDYLHSVHHVVFESPEELLPPGMQPIILQEQERFGEKEFKCVAAKF